MYNQPEKILEQYDLEINQITKGRGNYICDTSQGMKLLVPFRGSKERAVFLREVLERLKENGYPAEQITLTSQGEPLAEDEAGICYWLKTAVAGSECTTGRESDMKQAVRQLALLHEAVARCGITVPDFMISSRSDPRILYERHYREMVKVKNYVRTRKSKNDFELLFQEQYPHYIADAGRAVELLDEASAAGTYLLCHGDMNQHNVVRTPEGFRVINFENMCYNPAMSDLANFLRKMLEKNNWNKQLGMGLIEEYEKLRAITAEDRRLLYLIMLFPEKFWKISNHYTNSHKAWLPQRDIEKLERVIRQENARHLFLENLFSIT